MKRIFFTLIFFCMILSGCSKANAPEPGSALPSFEAYRKAQEVKELSNDRNEEMKKALNE